MDKKEEKNKTTKSFDDAMLAFQMLALSASKDGKNPHFKSTYATLEAVMDAARQGNQFGLYFTQPLDLVAIEGHVVQVVKTIITHVPSGKSKESLCPVRVKDKDNPQQMGSGITYAKRYALQSAYGLPSEDDDGNDASKAKPHVVKPDNDEPVGSEFEL